MAGGTPETKAAKFSRLASARVKRAVKAINLVGALASAQYEKTPTQVDKIESYLNAAVRGAVARLRGEAEADNTIWAFPVETGRLLVPFFFSGSL